MVLEPLFAAAIDKDRAYVALAVDVPGLRAWSFRLVGFWRTWSGLLELWRNRQSAGAPLGPSGGRLEPTRILAQQPGRCLYVPAGLEGIGEGDPEPLEIAGIKPGKANPNTLAGDDHLSGQRDRLWFGSCLNRERLSALDGGDYERLVPARLAHDGREGLYRSTRRTALDKRKERGRVHQARIPAQSPPPPGSIQARERSITAPTESPPRGTARNQAAGLKSGRGYRAFAPTRRREPRGVRRSMSGEDE